MQLSDLLLVQEHSTVATLRLVLWEFLFLHRHVDHVKVFIDRRVAGQVPALWTGMLQNKINWNSTLSGLIDPSISV